MKFLMIYWFKCFSKFKTYTRKFFVVFNSFNNVKIEFKYSMFCRFLFGKPNWC